ncbi:hypothetical protein [Streptococcus gallolyticus]|uniref:hypothetical protein n=1 Tax=Streptococcus gallolyticus TaxID=315405 RepID=UPI00088706E1|nr:hypothetical protein [Streptococcus gallolyticus]SDK34448.1 hypothetical protein SAMN04487842_2138 [Streptococcus gallolyticus]SDL83647.1 hypothetical protein SAMN04487841_2143 [Streptococcus gallolyticus]
MKKKMKLAILLMATALIGVSQDQGLLTTSVENNHVVLADSATSKSQTVVKKAEKAVKKLEENQTRVNLKNAKNKVAKLADSSQKEELNHRIDLVEQAIIIKEAETAVKSLEDDQIRDNLQSAKDKVALVSDEGTKASLNNRINLVEQAIIIKEAETAVKSLEDNQTRDNLQSAKDKVALVSDEGTKASLDNRVNLVEQAIIAKETPQVPAQPSQVQSANGYKKDYRGRWHRPNGQYASKAEIAAAGLDW